MSEAFEVHQIAALTHGQYLVDRGAAAASGAPLLVGCHGYGENAERHLEQLRQIPGAERWILCSVAALHPFYNTKTGEVIGSWMTSQARELAIGDNIRYVASVVGALRSAYETSETTVMAGFSQGVAMAYRAAVRGGFGCHGLIALAGDVPPELAASSLAVFPPVLIGRGIADTWYSEEKMRRDLEALAAKQTAVETCVFDGGHDWTPDFFAAAGRFLAARERAA